jgi:hypothetical protein
MKLLVENIKQATVIKEAAGNGKHHYFLEGVFLQGGIQNRNGRVYPTNILNKEVDRYRKEFVTRRRAFGEFGHPASPSIQMERISHLITQLDRDGNDFRGRAKIIDEGYGKIARALIDEGALLGMSSRGVGSVMTRQGVSTVGEDFQLTTAADIVAEPSAPDAFVEGVMENADWVQGMDGKWRRKFIAETKQQILSARKVSNAEVERVFMNAFDKLMANIAHV